MIDHVIDAERRFADMTAEEYRSKGYHVLRECKLGFLPGFIADLVVWKAKETKVIEVKSRSNLGDTSRIDELARTLESKPDWSFELLLVGEPEVLYAPEMIQSLAGHRIFGRLEEAEHALQHGLSEAAFLLAWSACEAALRASIAVQGVGITRITKAEYILDWAISHGVISREDYDRLIDMMKYRNAIAHGFATPDFSDELVMGLIRTVAELAASE